MIIALYFVHLFPYINIFNYINLGKTGGPSPTSKAPSQSSTVKPTSVSGNLLAKKKHKYCTPIPEITVMMETTFFINVGKTGGQSTTTKPPSQSSTAKPTSVSGNLHAESKT